MPTIDFTAARARVLKLAVEHDAYVEFTNEELEPATKRATIADLLRDCINEVGARGVRQELSR